MRKIFVSRPTRVLPEHNLGLSKLSEILRQYGLDPRTIGVTDRATRTPLQEVIQLMNQCCGAVVLGVPQIEVRSGTVRGDEIERPFSLGTEWNHIEAALAYALELPVLVIHDVTVGRGIFDRGAANAFIYSVDFSSDFWPLAEDISSVIRTWSTQLRAE